MKKRRKRNKWIVEEKYWKTFGRPLRLCLPRHILIKLGVIQFEEKQKTKRDRV